jgi:hypothetical protein
LIGGAIAQSQFSTALGGATTLAMTGGKIDSSTALSGAGLYVIEGATATLDGTTVSNNVANGSTNANFGNGGGIFNSGHLTIKDSANTGNSQLLGNKVVADTAAPPGFTGTGGAIINDSSTATPTLTISNTIVGGTTTAAANNGNLGAGIANIAPAQTTATSVKVEGNTGVEGVGLYGGGTVSLTGSSISNNAATFEGGGFFETPISTSDHPSFTLNGTSLGSNTATTAAGGGLVNVLSTFSMTGGSIANNLSAEGGGLFVIGKGASSTAGVATLDGTLVTNNTATAAANEGNGGAIFNAGTVTIKDSANTGNSVITGNRATAGTSGVTGYGGAIFNGPFTPGDAPSLTITGTSLGSTSPTRRRSAGRSPTWGMCSVSVRRRRHQDGSTSPAGP